MRCQRFELTLRATYSEADVASRTYVVDAADEDQARLLAAIRFGREEFDAGRTMPPTGVEVT